MSIQNYLTQNSKIKAMSGVKTFNFGIPAYRAASGFVTCPYAGTCASGCYAQQGAYVWGNVKPAFERRLDLTKSPAFVTIIDAEIKRRKIARVRIHDSGDFYSPQYLEKWLEIIRRNPLTSFYAYSKSIPFFMRVEMPDNFQVIFSEGGKLDDWIKPTDRHSRVFTSLAELQKAGYADASKDDSNATGKNKRVGLIYHGAKSKAWNTEKSAS